MKRILTLIVPVFLFNNCIFSQTPSIYKEALAFIQNKYDISSAAAKRENIYRQNGVVHIFIDQDGNLLGTGIPTTAQEGDRFVVHVVYNIPDKLIFALNYQGAFTPTLNIYGEKKTADQSLTTGIHVDEIIFATIGPFTGSLKLNVTRKDPDKTELTSILDPTITLAKIYHASISAGLFGTTLKDPQNISLFVNPNGDTTLLADDPQLRGLGAIMVTYYLRGRTMLFSPSGSSFSERFGICLGTRLDKDQFRNFFVGPQFDFAKGGSLAFGVHFGERNFIQGYDKFKYGSDIFSGSLDGRIRKEWSAGFYFGAQIDLRIFAQLFGATSAP